MMGDGCIMYLVNRAEMITNKIIPTPPPPVSPSSGSLFSLSRRKHVHVGTVPPRYRYREYDYDPMFGMVGKSTLTNTTPLVRCYSRAWPREGTVRSDRA